MITPDELRSLALFADLSDEYLQWIAGVSGERQLQPGEVLLAEGDSADLFYVLLDGQVQVTKRIGGQDAILANRGRGTFVGEISLLTNVPLTATVRALGETRLLSMTSQPFSQMLVTCPSVTLTILSHMARRLQDTEARVRQWEKMASLGSLAAGLAHELNNPASAAARAAGQLRQTLMALQALASRLFRQPLSLDQLDILDTFQSEVIALAAQAAPIDPLTQSDREEAFCAWIDARGVADSWRLAPTLVSAGLSLDHLELLERALGEALLPDLLPWIEGTLEVAELLATIEHGTRRIADLVQAVKSYSYMDQGPMQDVDVHEGLENTLIILGHKLKAGNVKVIRDYDRSLPRIPAYGSELNQVWTNLIDNAIDALNGQGRIWLRTACENECVRVEVADDGPGIPPEIQSRVFEPFFTTKPVGQGTGLGLDITYRIVVNTHHGDIRLVSQPGDTRFQVFLPVKPPETTSPG